jgi:hypothetical protein
MAVMSYGYEKFDLKKLRKNMDKIYYNEWFLNCENGIAIMEEIVKIMDYSCRIKFIVVGIWKVADVEIPEEYKYSNKNEAKIVDITDMYFEIDLYDGYLKPLYKKYVEDADLKLRYGKFTRESSDFAIQDVYDESQKNFEEFLRSRVLDLCMCIMKKGAEKRHELREIEKDVDNLVLKVKSFEREKFDGHTLIGSD